MRTITGSFKHDETFPLPCWHDENEILQYDTEWADELVSRCYGEDLNKYELNKSSLELYYLVSERMRFKIAEITYESYYTDIKGRDWEEDWLQTWADINKEEGGEENDPEDYEMYNLTLFHYDHPALKSNLLKNGKLKGINSQEYIKEIMKKIERGERESPNRIPEDEDNWFDEGDDNYYK